MIIISIWREQYTSFPLCVLFISMLDAPFCNFKVSLGKEFIPEKPGDGLKEGFHHIKGEGSLYPDSRFDLRLPSGKCSFPFFFLWENVFQMCF